MGIAGAGNSGTLIATFFGPRLAQHFGWHSVFGIALLPVIAVMVLYFLLAKDSPARSAPKPWAKYGSLLTQGDTWRLCFLYSLTFGGFVGMTSFLSVFFHDQYHLSKVQAGDITSIVVLSGSFLRPVGGWLSTRSAATVCCSGSLAEWLLSARGQQTSRARNCGSDAFSLMGFLGMGNGAVFQIAPSVFQATSKSLRGS